MTQTKECTRCHETKPWSAFPRQKTARGEYRPHPRCKPCKREYEREKGYGRKHQAKKRLEAKTGIVAERAVAQRVSPEVVARRRAEEALAKPIPAKIGTHRLSADDVYSHRLEAARRMARYLRTRDCSRCGSGGIGKDVVLQVNDDGCYKLVGPNAHLVRRLIQRIGVSSKLVQEVADTCDALCSGCVAEERAAFPRAS